MNSNKEKAKQIEISLFNGESLTDWIRDQLISKLHSRYKIGFMAADMEVSYHQLWRFMKGEKMNETFINKAFQYLLSCMGEILE